MLCDRCLGRRLIGAQGAAQPAAGAQYRGEQNLSLVEEAECPVCEGRFTEADGWLELLVDGVKDYEFETFQLGTIFPKPCQDVERAHGHISPDIGDSVRTEANRLLAPMLAEATGKTAVTDGRPDIQVHLDTRFDTVTVTPNSVYIFGRYNKLRRDVPQTHWPCKECQGTGCHICEDKGWQYESSVEQVIGDILCPAFEGTHYSFHGAGREDIDALMLGTGRPFVLEVANPRRRTQKLEPLMEAINATTKESGVGVTMLEHTDKAKVAHIKDATYNKEYLAHCVTESPLSAEQIEAAAKEMTGVVLQQRTPERVAHRRADLVRERRVHHMLVDKIDDETHFSVRVLADSGAYIKEMVNGDGGRTTPCLADVLGVPTRVEFLDVMAILD